MRAGFCVATAIRLEQVFRLILELVEVGTNGQSACGHDEPPDTPGVRWLGRRRFVCTSLRETLT